MAYIIAEPCIGTKDTNTLSAQSFGPYGGQIVSSLPVSTEVLEEYKNVKGKNIYSGPSAHPESAAKIWSRITDSLEKGVLTGWSSSLKSGFNLRSSLIVVMILIE